MLRFLSSLAAAILMFTAYSQNRRTDLSLFTGKYEANGFVIQVIDKDKQLLLAVTGAPLQPLIRVEGNKFKSGAFEREYFLFVEENGKVVKLISQGDNRSIEFQKISDKPDDFNGADSILTLRKRTDHFVFIYSAGDSQNVDAIARHLEKDRGRILRDFKLSSIPTTVVRIYPTAESFHQGINFPNAPSNILATVFGKDDFRMISPNSTDSVELKRHVTHEFTHCVHLNISYSPNNPRWLWEGVAMYEAGWFFDPKGIDVIRNKQFPSFASFNNGLEYELGFVIIEAIREIWGFEVVVELIKEKGNVQEVLKISQPDFEKGIYDHIQAKYR